jgi:hypothetical protein
MHGFEANSLLALVEVHQWVMGATTPAHAPRGAQRVENPLKYHGDSAALCLAEQHAERTLAADQLRFIA